MELAAKLAGFFAGHAVWCVSEGETLIPLLGFETPDGERQMHRFEAEKTDVGAREGQERLDQNVDGAARATLVVDGFVNLPAGKTDALIIDIRDYGLPSRSLLMVVPYRHANSPAGFAVHRPKFLSFGGPEPDNTLIASAFFEGVNSHEHAAPLWTRYLDESV